MCAALGSPTKDITVSFINETNLALTSNALVFKIILRLDYNLRKRTQLDTRCWF